MLKKCNKLNCEDCFAKNLNGYCIALRDVPDGKCNFYKNKYDMKKRDYHMIMNPLITI